MNRTKVSDRELAVLLGVIRGRPNREIAQRLGVSPAVVRECEIGLKAKLNAGNRMELAIRGVQYGFLAYLNDSS